MSDTPRTDEQTFDVVVKRGDAHLGREHYKDGSGDFVESDFCKKLERELNAANRRIKRLEEAGNALLWYFCPKNTGDISFLQSEAIKQWNKAKEDKL